VQSHLSPRAAPSAPLSAACSLSRPPSAPASPRGSWSDSDAPCALLNGGVLRPRSSRGSSPATSRPGSPARPGAALGVGAPFAHLGGSLRVVGDHGSELAPDAAPRTPAAQRSAEMLWPLSPETPALAGGKGSRERPPLQPLPPPAELALAASSPRSSRLCGVLPATCGVLRSPLPMDAGQLIEMGFKSLVASLAHLVSAPNALLALAAPEKGAPALPG